LLFFPPLLLLPPPLSLLLLSSPLSPSPLSEHRPLVVSSHRLVVLLPLIAPPSHRPLTPPILLSCAGWLLHASRPAALLMCRPLVLSSSSHCATLLLSHLTGWLLHRLLLHRPLIVLSLRHSFVVLHRLVVASTLVAPPSCPLVMLPSRPLVILYLKLVEPGSPDPFDATFMVPRERSSRTSPASPLAHTKWSRCWDQTSSMNQMPLTLPCLAQ
jgi:hypothetical protein